MYTMSDRKNKKLHYTYTDIIDNFALYSCKR